MTDAKLQRLEQCKRCPNSTEDDNFRGGTELYCSLKGNPCNIIKQCEYILDNNIRNLTDEETDIYNSSLEAEAKTIDGISLVRCISCKYAVRNKEGELNPHDIVCSMWCSDGFEAGDYCSRGEEGIYVSDDNCIQDQEGYDLITH